MNNIFLIVDNPTDYDSSPSPIGYVLTEDEAKSYVAKENKIYNEAFELIQNISKEMIRYRETLPSVELDPILPIPKWASGIAGIDITPSMRKERDDIIAKNNARQENYREDSLRKNKLVFKHILETFTISDEVKKHLDIDEPFGRIRLIEYLEKTSPYNYEPLKQLI